MKPEQPVNAPAQPFCVARPISYSAATEYSRHQTRCPSTAWRTAWRTPACWLGLDIAPAKSEIEILDEHEDEDGDGEMRLFGCEAVH